MGRTSGKRAAVYLQFAVSRQLSAVEPCHGLEDKFHRLLEILSSASYRINVIIYIYTFLQKSVNTSSGMVAVEHFLNPTLKTRQNSVF